MGCSSCNRSGGRRQPYSYNASYVRPIVRPYDPRAYPYPYVAPYSAIPPTYEVPLSIGYPAINAQANYLPMGYYNHIRKYYYWY